MIDMHRVLESHSDMGFREADTENGGFVFESDGGFAGRVIPDYAFGLGECRRSAAADEGEVVC